MQGLALSARSRLALCRRRSRAGRAESPPGRRGAQPHIADRATLPHPPPVPAFKRRRGGLGYRIPNGGVGGEDCLESRPARLGGLRQEIARRAGRPSLPKDPQQPSQLSAGLTEASAPRPPPPPAPRSRTAPACASPPSSTSSPASCRRRCRPAAPAAAASGPSPCCTKPRRNPPAAHPAPTSHQHRALLPGHACARFTFSAIASFGTPPPPNALSPADGRPGGAARAAAAPERAAR